MKIKEFFKSNVVLFILAVLISGAGASGITGGARLMAAKKEAVTYEERLDKAVREYESAETVSIVTEDVPRIGSKNAPASFTVFFDYTCNHCMYEINFLEKLIKKYPDAVAVNFKFLPLNGVCGTLDKGRDDKWAEGCVSAAAAYAANMQNRFMEYSNRLFDSYHNKNQKLTQSVVRDLAKKAKLDMSAFEKDFTSESAVKFIKREYDESEKLNINSTPTVYLNGKLLTKGLRKNDIMEGLVQYCVKRGE
jgi:predicted DsbA family dithiol-disulfide isomerase